MTTPEITVEIPSLTPDTVSVRIPSDCLAVRYAPEGDGSTTISISQRGNSTHINFDQNSTPATAAADMICQDIKRHLAEVFKEMDAAGKLFREETKTRNTLDINLTLEQVVRGLAQKPNESHVPLLTDGQADSIISEFDRMSATLPQNQTATPAASR